MWALHNRIGLNYNFHYIYMMNKYFLDYSLLPFICKNCLYIKYSITKQAFQIFVFNKLCMIDMVLPDRGKSIRNR